MNKINQEVTVAPAVSPIYNPLLDLYPKFYSIHQAALMMGYSSITIRNWISQGKCPFETVRRGGKRLVVISSFNDFINGVESISDVVDSSTTKRPRGRPRKLAKEITQTSNV